MTSPYLLHYAPDNASLIIRLALEELNLKYETILVDRGLSEHQSEAYLELNPAGRIPTLVTPQGPISETAAILLWLADRHGALLPPISDPFRGATLNWLLFLSNTLHADMNVLFYTCRYGPAEAVPEIRRALQNRIVTHLKILEIKALPRLNGWLGGDNPSALDLYLAALIRWVQIYPKENGLLLDPLNVHRLVDICRRLENRPSTLAFCEAEGVSPHPFTRPRSLNH